METAIKTESGYEFRVDEDVVDDIRLFELIKKHDSGLRMDQISAASEIVMLFMGEEQKEAYYAYLSGREGRPKISVIERDINGILTNLSTPKKK